MVTVDELYTEEEAAAEAPQMDADQGRMPYAEFATFAKPLKVFVMLCPRGDMRATLSSIWG